MDIAGPSVASNLHMGGLPSPGIEYESAYCQGCKNPIDSDPLHGGVVVQFASSLWHTACFQCAKCGDQLSAQSTLVLLNDGSPVCSKCSYVCNVCKLEINDEAIMTGEDAYHASCFTCRTCHKRIEELVFAKTSQGIYCMDCHNDRVARSRRRAEHKQSKNRSRRPKEGDHSQGSSTKPSSRPGTNGNRLPHQPSNGHMGDYSSSELSHTPPPPHPTPSRSGSKQAVPQDVDPSYVSDLGELNDAILQPSGMPPHVLGSAVVLTPDETDTGFGGLQDEPEVQAQAHDRNPSPTNGLANRRQETVPVRPTMPAAQDAKRSKSYDDGTRPSQAYAGNQQYQAEPSSSDAPNPNRASNNSIASMSLDIPKRNSTKAERRRSMNPPPRVVDEPVDDSRGRSASSGSDTSGYYSPSSAGHAQNLDVQPQQRSRSRSPSFSRAQQDDGGGRTSGPSSRRPSAADVTTPSPSPSFPPRGNSLNNPKASASNAISQARPKLPTPEPSFSIEPASDDEDSGQVLAAPVPPPKDDSPSRSGTPVLHHEAFSSIPSTPGSSTTATYEEATPVQTRRPKAAAELLTGSSDSATPGSPPSSATLVAPALPPIRLSLHGTDFADLLKTVADGSPRVPMPRDSQLKLTLSPDGSSGPSAAGTSGSDSESPIFAKQRNRIVGQRSDLPSDVLEENEDDDDDTIDISAAAREAGLYVGPGSGASDEFTISLTPPGSNGTTPTAPQATTNDSQSSTTGSTAVASPAAGVDSATTSRSRSGSAATFGDGSPLQVEKQLPSLNGAASDLLRPNALRRDSAADLASKRLREALNDANARGAASLKLDPEFAEVLLRSLDSSKEAFSGLRSDLDNVKRTSHQYMKGFSVAQEEYQKEVAHRKDLEAEVNRLRVQLAGQAARLVAVTAQDRTQAVLDKLAVDTTNRLQGLEHEVARLKTDRDMALAEIEELGFIKKAGGAGGNEAIANVSRALSSRLEYAKAQVRKELEPLEEKRERLMHDIAELREARAIFVEETTALNTRNEQLAELNAQIALQIQTAAADGVTMGMSNLTALARGQGMLSQENLLPTVAEGTPLGRPPAPATARARRPDLRERAKNSPSIVSTTTVGTLVGSQESAEEFGPRGVRIMKAEAPEPVQPKKFKWFAPSAKHNNSPGAPATSERGAMPTLAEKQANGHLGDRMHNHNFTSYNMLRIGRCDQCGDKLWGAGLRCSNCSFACHIRCGIQVKGTCKHTDQHDEPGEMVPLPPSMFGRDLIEQARADDRGTGRMIPVIVEKCLEAVEAIGLEYEGIYRKTGGASESKAITQLFERGQYDRIDLLNTDVFHDISSVTSVLKNYFRALPNPLFTYEHHDSFIQSASLRDPPTRIAALQALVQDLPPEHLQTVKALMLHLHKVERHKDVNLMNARNLGVVFGPTLMRHRDPGQEFADMAGKATTIEWLVNHAPTVFGEAS